MSQTYYVHESLPEHTLFHPENLSDFESLPVVVWGNGACSADPVAGHGPFLEELASWGILVIALGTPGNGGSTSNEQMTQAIDWASVNAGQGEWSNIDATQLAAAGMSCGGTQAYAQNQDSRVTAFGIFNSGTLDPSQTDATLGAINVPIFFFLGGPTDIAYENVSPTVRVKKSFGFPLLTDGNRACETTKPSTPAYRPGSGTSMSATVVPTSTQTVASSAQLVNPTSAGSSAERQKPLLTSSTAELRPMDGRPLARTLEASRFDIFGQG